VRDIGLNFKLLLFTIALVLLVDLLVSAPLYFILTSMRQEMLLKTIIVISVVALAFGILGALAISYLLITPMLKLARRDGLTHDTEGSAHASISDLNIGKEIQRKFIPLDVDKDGNKLNSGYKDTKNAVFFGYYKSAQGLSGDYFDYLDLGGRYYAVIKCDVAGKGIPASLIMMQVATMFLNYFKKWDPDANGTRLEELVCQINGFIETLGFIGRFAAFTLCLFDSQTGDLHFCNAGDNIIHIYDASEKKAKSITLPQAPAAGALSNDIVESKGGYKTQTLSLDHGDILLLYTDGIEAIGSGQVHEILNAVMNRAVYRMTKRSEGDNELCFDYSDCNGEVEEGIMALITAEKMFRCYRNTEAEADDVVLIEKKADAFLKAHFQQYADYCSSIRECTENSSNMYYAYLNEDEQYDDLAILGIKRK
jgi:serine phosphatase RsbU (regulator of sigma subunit)